MPSLDEVLAAPEAHKLAIAALKETLRGLHNGPARQAYLASRNMPMQHPLKSFRDSKRLTQQRLAEAMGIRRDAVAKIEGGLRSVSVGELAKLREVLSLADAEVSALIEHLGRAEAA